MADDVEEQPREGQVRHETEDLGHPPELLVAALAGLHVVRGPDAHPVQVSVRVARAQNLINTRTWLSFCPCSA